MQRHQRARGQTQTVTCLRSPRLGAFFVLFLMLVRWLESAAIAMIMSALYLPRVLSRATLITVRWCKSTHPILSLIRQRGTSGLSGGAPFRGRKLSVLRGHEWGLRLWGLFSLPGYLAVTLRACKYAIEVLGNRAPAVEMAVSECWIATSFVVFVCVSIHQASSMLREFW